MHNGNHRITLCDVYSYCIGCVISFIRLTVTDTKTFVLFTEYVSTLYTITKFSNDNIKRKITSCIQTNRAYFCFTVSSKAADADFQIFLFQITTGLSQLHVSRRSFRKWLRPVAYPGIFFMGGGGSTNSVEDRENGDLGVVAPLVRGSGGTCNLVQEI